MQVGQVRECGGKELGAWRMGPSGVLASVSLGPQR